MDCKNLNLVNNFVLCKKKNRSEYNGIVLPDNDIEKIEEFNVICDTIIKDNYNNDIKLNKNDIIIAKAFDAIPYVVEGEEFYIINGTNIIAYKNKNKNDNNNNDKQILTD